MQKTILALIIVAAIPGQASTLRCTGLFPISANESIRSLIEEVEFPSRLAGTTEQAFMHRQKISDKQLVELIKSWKWLGEKLAQFNSSASFEESLKAFQIQTENATLARRILHQGRTNGFYDQLLAADPWLFDTLEHRDDLLWEMWAQHNFMYLSRRNGFHLQFNQAILNLEAKTEALKDVMIYRRSSTSLPIAREVAYLERATETINSLYLELNLIVAIYRKSTNMLDYTGALANSAHQLAARLSDYQSIFPQEDRRFAFENQILLPDLAARLQLLINKIETGTRHSP